MQEIIVYIVVFVAVAFLIKKIFFPAKKKNCGTDCGCH